MRHAGARVNLFSLPLKKKEARGPLPAPSSQLSLLSPLCAALGLDRYLDVALRLRPRRASVTCAAHLGTSPSRARATPTPPPRTVF